MKHPECGGTAGAKTADTVETTIPLAKLQSLQTVKEQGQGKANAGAEEILLEGESEGKKDSETLQNKSQRRGTLVPFALY